MTTHVMIDLETLSTRKDAAIVQLAAVAFDPETGERGAAYTAFVLPQDGEHIDPATVAWWLRQKAAPALGEALNDSAKTMPLGQALCGLWAFFDTVKPEAVWSHGTSFDIAIVEHHCAVLGLSIPWHYRAPRDTRTLYALAPGGMPKVEVDETLQHDALYDCEIQIKQVVGALKALRGTAQVGQYADALADAVSAFTAYYSEGDDDQVNEAFDSLVSALVRWQEATKRA